MSMNTDFRAYFNEIQYVNGDSAYEIAVNNGFKGTEKEWLESLKGGKVTLEDIVEALGYEPASKILLDDLTSDVGTLLGGVLKKVNKSDIVDSLTSDATDKPLSAAQGKVLKELLDEIAATVEELRTK